MKIRSILESLSVDQSMKILNLRQGFDLKDLKKAYHAASLKSHPDKGGDLEQMKQINNAYDMLTKLAAGNDSKAAERAAREARTETATKTAEFVRDSVVNALDVTVYTRYFEKIFGNKFSASTEKIDDSYFRNYRVKFVADNDPIYFTLLFVVSISDYYNTRLTGDVSVSVYGSGFFNNREYKLYRSAWYGEAKKMVSDLSDPKSIFPESKIQKHLSNKRKASKRDFTNLLGKLQAVSLGKDLWAIPTKTEDIYLYLNRHVFMGTPGWMTGFYRKQGKFSYRRDSNYDDHLTLPEVEDLLTLLPRVSELTPAEISKELDNIKNKS